MTEQAAERKSSIQKDGRRLKIYPADVRGRFSRARQFTFLGLIGILLALPFVTVRGRPGIWLDVGERRFYLLGSTFNAQDVYLMFFLLTGLAFTIVLATAILGRVWCGWLCPQTVFLEGLFRPIERIIQGSRNVRMKRDAGEWTFDRAWRFALTQFAYLAIAALIAHILVAYFVSFSRLFVMMSRGPSHNPEPFVWVAATTAVLYFNFAWFREQTCLVVCPYGRMQSVLFDRDSLIIGYDEKRGEPRGKKGQGGDCVDCNRCVVVCPTGIDIRNGLQVDCVACAACVDACDEVMVKVGKPKGLVRYDSMRGLESNVRKFLRPRLFLYLGILVVGLAGFSVVLGRRTSFEANILRLPGAPYELVGDSAKNAFQIHLVNKNDHRERYVIETQDTRGFQVIIPMHDVELEASSSRSIPLFVIGPRGAVGDVIVSVVHANAKDSKILRAPFLAPPKGVSP